MKTLILMFLLVGPVSQEQPPPINVATKISEVTVFLQQAQVTRTGLHSLQPGIHTLKVGNLSPYMDPESVKVTAKGDFTILSIRRLKSYPSQLVTDQKKDSIQQAIEAIQKEVDWHQARQKILQEQQDLLKVNRSLGSEQKPAGVEELALALRFYDQQLTKINKESLQLEYEIAQANLRIEDLEKRLVLTANQHELPNNEIEIRVDVSARTSAQFEVSYLVGKAGWFPKYDVRVNDLSDPVSLTYKAQVYQNTGVDWDQVKLKFSNAEPNKSGLVPALQPWYLGYQTSSASTEFESFDQALQGKISGVIVSSRGEPIPGVNIIQKGSTNGTVTDVDGRYSLTMAPGQNTVVVSSIGYNSQEIDGSRLSGRLVLTEDITELNEVVVTAMGSAGRRNRRVPKKKELISSIATTIVENQTTVEIAVDKPYTLKSQSESSLIDLDVLEMPASYQYYAVPKLEQQAFLVARIVNWDQYNLLAGEANLYFENSFVGKSMLDTQFLQDTLDLSLGRDRSIILSRTKQDHFTRRTFIGPNKVDKREFELLVRNQKKREINITVYDQIPLSSRDQISVEILKLSSGKHNPDTGQVEWNLTIAPAQQTQVVLGYEVRYPKYQQLTLE